MNADGQVYADWDGTASNEDLERYNKAHLALISDAAERVTERMNELERMLGDAEAG
jgi:hypothetical protein